MRDRAHARGIERVCLCMCVEKEEERDINECERVRVRVRDRISVESGCEGATERQIEAQRETAKEDRCDRQSERVICNTIKES